MIKLITELLNRAGFKYEPSFFYLHKTNKDNYYSIVYRHMGTKIHIPESQIDIEECVNNNIQICKTWEY